MEKANEHKEIKLICQRCSYLWNYRGEKSIIQEYKLYTSCPRCKTSVKIEEKN